MGKGTLIHSLVHTSVHPFSKSLLSSVEGQNLSFVLGLHVQKTDMVLPLWNFSSRRRPVIRYTVRFERGGTGPHGSTEENLYLDSQG